MSAPISFVFVFGDVDVPGEVDNDNATVGDNAELATGLMLVTTTGGINVVGEVLELILIPGLAIGEVFVLVLGLGLPLVAQDVPRQFAEGTPESVAAFWRKFCLCWAIIIIKRSDAAKRRIHSMMFFGLFLPVFFALFTGGFFFFAILTP